MGGAQAELTVRFLVAGEVQGVGFRYFVLRRAATAGLCGWARNLADGRVEVVARGSPEALRTLEAQLRAGPPQASVADVEKIEISDEIIGTTTFEIR